MIEIEEYVRTEKGYIFKVNEDIIIFNTDNDNQLFVDMESTPYGFCDEEKIVKHSKNIIDLIEDTDILQIEISTEWVEKENSIAFIIVGQTYTIDEIKEALENGMYKIKKILTKEQFLQNSYEVEE